VPSRFVRFSLMLVVALSMGTMSNAQSRPSAAAAVYAALFDQTLTRRSDTLLFGDSTSSNPQVSTDGGAYWRKSFPRSVVPLVLQLEQLARVARPTSELPLPRPMRVIEAADRTKQRYEYFRVSPVAFSADSVDAVVAFDRICSPRCGSGAVAWLSRRGGDRRWHVQGTAMTWIS
jgi:hypothetical protein